MQYSINYQARAYEKTEKDQERINALLSFIPNDQNSLLEIGAASGQVTLLLTPMFKKITALDLQKPSISHEKIENVEGDVTKLAFLNNSFDVILCAEVLEHISPSLLPTACNEIMRVARHFIVIGVPYKQDLRIARMHCSSCGKNIPSFGHFNTFDEQRLKKLFHDVIPLKTEFIGQSRSRTNWISSILMDLGKNPWGSYDPRQNCIYCGSKLSPPAQRNIFHKACSKISCAIDDIQRPFISPFPQWIHILFKKEGTWS